VYSHRSLPTFWWNILPPYSGLKNNPSKKPARSNNKQNQNFRPSDEQEKRALFRITVFLSQEGN
jgi:hypothetical protein